LLIGAGLLLQACTDRVVYTSVTGQNGLGEVFVYTPAQSATVAISASYGPARPCGRTSDNRLVLNVHTLIGGTDEIYLADPTTGEIQEQVSDGLAQSNDRCVFVTSDDFVIYETTRPTNNVFSDLMATKVGSGLMQTIAAGPEEERFLGMAPDKRVIFSRRPLHVSVGSGYHLMSAPIGGPATMLAQMFPPPGPQFNGVTSGNRVIYSMFVEFQQGSFSLNILGVNTNGTNPGVVAQNSPWSEYFCLITSDNRILFTEKSLKPFFPNGQERLGSIYSVNPDGSNRLLLNPGPNPLIADFDDTCRGFTSDNRVIFTRTKTHPGSSGVEGLYSVLADGQSQPILLAPGSATLGSSTTNSFDRVTPNDRVLYWATTQMSVPGGTQFSSALNSVMPNGTGAVHLVDNPGSIGAVSTLGGDIVYYHAPVPANGPGAVNIFSIPASGGTPTQISSSPNRDDVNFIYVTR
jgi:hypothetical protein